MSQPIDTSGIPAEVLSEIRKQAKEVWPDLREWQDDFIRDEIAGYRAFQSVDFGAASSARESITADALEYFASWDERLSHVTEEIEAFVEFHATAPDDIPSEVLTEMKHTAAVEDEWFVIQLENLKGAIDAFRYVRETRRKVEPIRELLFRMEAIIGDECYNGNIQNYSSWGEWEGEGRSFRYPVTFIRNGSEEKRRGRVADLEHEELVTGYYKFGANELSIYRALIRIIDMLEKDFDFRRPDSVE